MRHRAFLMILAVLIALPSLSVAQFSVFPGVVAVDSVEVMPGSHFGVAVRLANNTLGIAGLQLPLRFSSPYLSVDSVSFAGSLKTSGMTATATIDNLSDTVSVIYYPDFNCFPIVTADAPSGVLATVYFSLAATAPPGPIAIMEINNGYSSTIWSGIGFVDAQGNGVYRPQGFVPGVVVVLAPTAIDDEAVQTLPSSLALAQNYPNPFNPTTTIEFTLPLAGHTRLEVFNVLGQRVVTLVDRALGGGTHQVQWDGADHPSGIYFYRLTHSEGAQTRKMILVK